MLRTLSLPRRAAALACCIVSACAHPQPATRSQTPLAAGPPVLRIIATNDFHGALETRANPAGLNWGGAAALAGAVRDARAQCVAPACQSILLDAGDEFQGQAPSTLLQGRTVPPIFNAMGYDAAALGNHDLDWGRDVLRERMAEEHYPTLSANLRYADGRPVEWMPADTIIHRGPFSVGIIGIMTREAGVSIAASNIVGLRFVDPVAIVDSLNDALRARGANVVVLVAHAGGRCDASGTGGCHGEIFELAQRFTRHIDAIIAGHSHELVNTSMGGVPITGARMSGQAIDVIDLRPSGAAAHDVRLVFADSIAPDTAIARMVRAAVNEVGPRLNAPIATIAEDLQRDDGEYALGHLIVDGIRAAGHADFAATNETGIRAPLRKGVATYASLFEIQPFNNRLVHITSTGAVMRRYFEALVGAHGPIAFISGAVVTADTTRPAGSRIRQITLPSGRALDDAATYSIVITDFMATGGLGLAFPDPTAPAHDLPLADLDATIQYLKGLPSPIHAPASPRWILLP